MVIIDPCDFSIPVPCGVNPSFTYTRYPCDIDDPRPLDTRGLPVIVDLQTPVKAEVTNRHREAILAVEGELGLQPSGTWGTVRARLDAMEALLCTISESSAISVFYNSLTVTNNIPVKQLNFFGDGVTVIEDPNFGTNGQVNVFIPCCGGGESACIDGYQPIQELLPVIINGQTVFSISQIPFNNTVLLFLNGLKQAVGEYVVIGTTLTWSGIALTTGDVVEVFYEVFHNDTFGNVYQPTIETLPVPFDGYTNFTLSNVPKNNLVLLFIDGLNNH